MPLNWQFFCAYWQYGVTGFCKTGKWRTIKKQGGWNLQDWKMSVIFQSCKFYPCDFVRHFQSCKFSYPTICDFILVFLYWYTLGTEALHHRCPTISTSRLAQSVVTYPVVVRDAGWRGKVASPLTSSLLNALAACSDFRCMPALFCKHINKLLIIFAAYGNIKMKNRNYTVAHKTWQSV